MMTQQQLEDLSMTTEMTRVLIKHADFSSMSQIYSITMPRNNRLLTHMHNTYQPSDRTTCLKPHYAGEHSCNLSCRRFLGNPSILWLTPEFRESFLEELRETFSPLPLAITVAMHDTQRLCDSTCVTLAHIARELVHKGIFDFRLLRLISPTLKVIESRFEKIKVTWLTAQAELAPSEDLERVKSFYRDVYTALRLHQIARVYHAHATFMQTWQTARPREYFQYGTQFVLP